MIRFFQIATLIVMVMGVFYLFNMPKNVDETLPIAWGIWRSDDLTIYNLYNAWIAPNRPTEQKYLRGLWGNCIVNEREYIGQYDVEIGLLDMRRGNSHFVGYFFGDIIEGRIISPTQIEITYTEKHVVKNEFVPFTVRYHWIGTGEWSTPW